MTVGGLFSWQINLISFSVGCLLSCVDLRMIVGYWLTVFERTQKRSAREQKLILKPGNYFSHNSSRGYIIRFVVTTFFAKPGKTKIWMVLWSIQFLDYSTKSSALVNATCFRFTAAVHFNALLHHSPSLWLRAIQNMDRYQKASGLVKLILKVTHIATIHPNAIFCVLKLSYVWWWSDILFGAMNSSIKILVIACCIDLLKNIMSGLAWLILGLIVKRFWHHRHHEMSWMLRASSGETISSVRWRSPGSISTFQRQNCYPHPRW